MSKSGAATVASVKQSISDLKEVILSLCRCAIAAADQKVSANSATAECRSVKIFFKGEAEKREAEVQQAVANIEAMAATLSSSNSAKVHELLAGMRRASWLFKDLVAFLKPLKESGLTTNSFQAYSKQVQEVMKQKLNVLLEAERPDVVESRRRSPVLAQYAKEDEEFVDNLEFIIKTQPWSKASKEISSLKSSHERAVSSRPSGNVVHQGPGLVGAEVARPSLVAFPQGNNNALAASPRASTLPRASVSTLPRGRVQTPAYIPPVSAAQTPAQIPAYIPPVSKQQRRVLVPSGGRVTRRASKVSKTSKRNRRVLY